MDSRGLELLIVRKSGPVQTMKIQSWWLFLILLCTIIIVAGLAWGGYILTQQKEILAEIGKENRLLAHRTERLEALVQEQETRAILAQQEADEKAAHLAAIQEEAKKKSRAAVKQSTPQPEPEPVPAGPVIPNPAQELVQGPKVSDLVEIRKIRPRTRGGDMVLSFEVANKQPDKGQVVGYVTVLLKGKRKDKPWIEAWPPMRLSPLGRPLNHKRGTPFAVSRYRRLRATFATADKNIKRLEFLVFNKDGELILVLAVGPDGKQLSSAEGPGPEAGDLG